MAEYEHNSDKFGYINLEDFDGVQDALTKLGFHPGEIDGKNGPNTQRAVRAFQAHMSIGIDGIVGPETRQALLSELDHRAEEGEAPAASYEPSAPRPA
ncbi:MAG TPA: peptidoglycan-binding domain-containing protein [Labilithrix sp.]|nr:peptidoglycan-binding domain-containing protein [Labilithrix sp.]